MKERYIIEYSAGCRGDFLCNFLNFNNLILRNNETLQSKCSFLHFKTLTNKSFYNKIPPSINELKIVIDKIDNNYTPSHAMHFFKKEHYNFLKENKFKVFKIKFSRKYYQNIWIESIFKSEASNLEVTDENNNISLQQKSDYIEKKLNEKQSDYSLYYDLFNKKNNENKIMIDYHDLFFDISLKKYFDFVDENIYKDFLKKIELKKEIELFGKKFYPADYGYVWNENL